MPEEVDLIRTDLRVDRETTFGLRSYYEGAIDGRDAVLVYSRCGKVAAASTVTTLIDRFKVDLVLFTGVAGAASPALGIGDIVVADELVQHDMDASGLPMFERFEIPLLGAKSFAIEARLRDQAVAAAKAFVRDDLFRVAPADVLSRFGIREPSVVIGLVASGDRFIDDRRTLDELRGALPRLCCVEMEGAAAAQVCHEHGVPLVVIRAISDKADHSAAIDFPGFIRDVASAYARGIVGHFLNRIE
jgi:adenosylhomocysteine nucleosidase